MSAAGWRGRGRTAARLRAAAGGAAVEGGGAPSDGGQQGVGWGPAPDRRGRRRCFCQRRRLRGA